MTTIADLAAIDVDHMANHYGGSKKFIAKWKNVAREYQEQPDEDLRLLTNAAAERIAAYTAEIDALHAHVRRQRHEVARLLRDARERLESLVVAN